MLARSSIFCADGIDAMQAVLISIAIMILSLAAGIWIFRRQDIMERK